MSEFLTFARAHGVLIDNLANDGRIHRCATNGHENKKNGAWMYDGRRGWVMAWDLDGEVHWFADPSAKQWTEEEKRAVAERRKAQHQRIELDQKRAAQKAQRLINSAQHGPSKYLAFKGFKERLQRHDTPTERHGYGLCLPDGALIVPMRSLTGVLQGAQVIRWNAETREHEKKMLPRMKAKGAVFWMGPRNARIVWLCEGYATALSIRMALDSMRFPDAVVACFSDINMAYVAPHIQGQKFVFADNDKSGAGERAAKATGLAYCMAPETGMDANDVMVRDGLFAVCGLIQRARTG